MVDGVVLPPRRRYAAPVYVTDEGRLVMDEGYSLVMPFVICESEGGQYDDRSFVAGWECAHIHDLLAGRPVELILMVHAGSLPQLDLIAMDRGYVMSSDGDDEWAMVSFRQASHPLRRVET